MEIRAFAHIQIHDGQNLPPRERGQIPEHQLSGRTITNNDSKLKTTNINHTK